LGQLPINKFFDLIVGTRYEFHSRLIFLYPRVLISHSTGGLVALGLGVKNWPVELCASHFEKLCLQAFTPREFHNVPVLEQLTTLSHKSSKYKTRPLKEALKEAFQDDQLFGGVCEDARYQRKVAVVSTSETGQRAVILTNYNRLQREAEPGVSKLQLPFGTF
jgi:patatin-like phospholipase/acyl hydrolase